MRASPVPPAEILAFASEACAVAGYPPTTPELDDKLRALGLLFGKAAPNSADLTHYLWHILEGNIPRALALQALEAVQECEFKGVAGVMTRNALEAARDDLGSIYGGEMLKNLGALLKSIARRAVEMTTSGMEGEVAAARSERIAAVQTIKALEADLTKIAKAYYGEEAPTGVSADGIADFIGEVKADRNTNAPLSRAQVADMRSAMDDLRRQRDEARAEAGVQRDRAAKANSDIAVITKAYFAAGFGPSPTTPEKVAAAIGDLLAARERAKQKASDAEAHAARWLKACKLLGWDTEADPAISSDGIGKMTAFMERMQALLVKPLRDELRSRQAPNLAAFGFGFEKATPERIVKIAAERSQADAREIGRLRAANRDLSAKIESAPGSGLRKRLKEAERIAGNPGELERRQVELEKVNSQIREATAQRNAVLAAARKDPTGKDEVATEQQREEHRRSMSRLYNDYQLLAEAVDPTMKWPTQAGSLPPAGAHSLVDKAKQHRQDAHRTERERRRHDEADSNYAALALAVCPFPKEHEALLKQAAAARDRAALECAKGLPDGYRIEEVLPLGWRWEIGSGTWGETLDSPGVAVRQAWRRLVNQVESAHREAVRYAEKRLAELEGQVPIRSVLLAAVQALGWKPEDGDPEDWAIGERRKFDNDLSCLRGYFCALANTIEPNTAFSSLVPPVDVQRALLDKARQLVNDAHTCEQHRRQVDHIDATLGRMLGKERAAGLTLDDRLTELAAQRDAYKKAAEPHPHAHAHMLEHLDLRAQAADMARVRDLLHDRRTKLALRDGEALSYAELVQGLLSAWHLAEHDLALVRGKGPSAADVLRGEWAGDVVKTEEVTSDVVWDGKAWMPRATHGRKFGGPGQPALDPAVIAGAVGYPPPMQHPGVLALSINTPDSLTGARPSLALWYKLGDKTWCLAQQQIEPMRWGDSLLITIPLGPKS